MRGSMRRTIPPLLVLCLFLGCSEPEGPGPRALLDRALAAVGGREALAGVKTLGIEYRGTAHPPEEIGVETAITGEYLLRIPGGLASGQSMAGLLVRRAVTPEGGWIREGAAVRDLDPAEAAGLRSDRDDLLAALVLPLLSRPFTVKSASGESAARAVRVSREGGDSFLLEFAPETGLPARIRRGPAGADGPITTFSDWSPRGALLFPGKIETAVGGGRQVIVPKDVLPNPETPGAVFERPDDSGPGTAGEIRREKLAATRILAVANRGRLTELASIDLFFERALAERNIRRTSPLTRIFRRFPGADGSAEVVTMATVEFPEGERVAGFPGGFRDEPIPATDLLVMPYRGPYPKDDSIYEPLYSRAGELGLVPTGPPWHAILSDPDEGEPNDLKQEIKLPVEAKK